MVELLARNPRHDPRPGDRFVGNGVEAVVMDVGGGFVGWTSRNSGHRYSCRLKNWAYATAFDKVIPRR